MFLSECWIPNDFTTELDNFTSYIIPRKQSEHVQGGGIVFLVKAKFAKFISLHESYFDSIVWLKIDKSINEQNRDTFFAFVYIPPANSTFYTHYDCDLFYELENQLSSLKDMRNIFVIGDFNARTKTHDDFVSNDNLPNCVRNHVECLFTYVNECCLSYACEP